MAGTVDQLQERIVRHLGIYPWTTATAMSKILDHRKDTVKSTLNKLLKATRIITSDAVVGPRGGRTYALPGTPVPNGDTVPTKLLWDWRWCFTCVLWRMTLPEDETCRTCHGPLGARRDA